MAETLELNWVLDELKKQWIDVQIEETSDDLFEVIEDGYWQCSGQCSTWSCSGGSWYRSPESFSEDEDLKMAA